MEARHLKSALDILRGSHYLVLATVCEDGSPWNTPVSATVDSDLSFTWGSSPLNQHSKNIEKEGRAFGVLFDSHAPEGTGEGLYFKGRAEVLRKESEDITLYTFVPERAWINDEAKKDDGAYKHDVRIELDLEELREAFSKGRE